MPLGRGRRRQGQGRGHGHHREGGRRPRLAPGGRLPIPKRIVEFDAVRDLEDGYIVVSTGGGGVPVFETGDGYVGTPAVIDK